MIEQDVIDYTKPSEERRFYLIIENQKIFVDEQTYKDYMRPIWRERKNELNRSRCMIAGPNGKAIRCMEDCSKCPLYKNNSILSLDKLEDDYEYEIVDSKETVLERKIKMDSYRPLYEALEELTDNQRKAIILHVLEEKTFQEIGDMLHMTRQGVHNLYTRGIDKIKKKINLKDFL